jgi:serine/threonine-protein kinase HipA
MERVARAVRALSTAPEEDLFTILRRALFAWLIADGDMHLKNIALLKIGARGETNFRSVRVAPLYDAVTTRVFPRLRHDRLALKLNGKDDRLRRTDFRALATHAGLKSGDADLVIDEMLHKLSAALGSTVLPDSLEFPQGYQETAAELLNTCSERISHFWA